MTKRKQPPPPTPTRQPRQDVIALSDYRQPARHGRPARRADALFASADPEAAIRALPGDELFHVIHEMGFPEAMDVLVHATAEQVQVVLDFSVWDRDRVSLDKSDDWLLALTQAPPQALGRWAQGIDVELLALLIRQRARIYDLSLEEPPDEPEGALWESPDRAFALDLLGDEDRARITQRLLDGLYRYSPVMMRRLLVGVRAESDAELEEAAYRWRAGRMADLGFAELPEALAVYQELDPATVHIPEAPAPSPRPKADIEPGPSHLPAVLADRLAGRSPFARGVAGLATRSEAADVHFALVALSNRALSADGVLPGDDEAARAVLERVAATLDLAVELLAHGDAEREVAAVRGLPVVTLHCLGASLTGKVRRLASALRRAHPYAKLGPGVDVFEPEDAEILASLSRARPLFPRLLEQPPAPGERPFATLADLAAATRAVERAAAALELLAGLGIRPADLDPLALDAQGKTAAGAAVASIDPATIDAGSVARTVLVTRLLDPGTTGFAPLAAAAVSTFKERFNAGMQLPEFARLAAEAILRGAAGTEPLAGARREVAERWIASLCPLGPVLRAGRSGPP